jgi:DnaK suppressor protein
MTKRMTADRRVEMHRHDELKAMLEQRRQDLLREVQNKVRLARADGGLEHDVIDETERTELDAQRELGFVLIQMATETLEKINVALLRLEENTYGNCVECLEPISEARLRALPFAVRCTPCEGAREITVRHERSVSAGASAPLVF